MSEQTKRTTISHQVCSSPMFSIHYDPSVLVRFKIFFKIIFPIRFGWSLQSTYKCSLMAMELDFLHLASHRWFKHFFLHIFSPFFRQLAFQNLLLQLASEGILTPEELGWFPGSLVLGQVLGILVGPLLADLVIAFVIHMAMDFNTLQYLYYFPT